MASAAPRRTRVKRPPLRRIPRLVRRLAMARPAEWEPAHRKNANPYAYRFVVEPSWEYMERAPGPNVTEDIIYGERRSPHLVLLDTHHTPRFVLGYREQPTGVLIQNIQRVRTRYGLTTNRDGKPEYEWDPIKETRDSKDLAHDLSSHPADFLVSEFLFRNRERILSRLRCINGVWHSPFKVQLDIFWNRYQLSHNKLIYGPIIRKFFAMHGIRRKFNVRYPLNFDRVRVREALGLPLEKITDWPPKK